MSWQHTEKSFGNQCLGNEQYTSENTWSERALLKYKELINSIYHQSLMKAYPICHSILEPTVWNTWVADFIKFSRSDEPRVWLMPRLFKEYVKTQKLGEKNHMPYMDDLLLFEWLEIEVFTELDINLPKISASINWDKDTVYFNPHAREMVLDYPVHRSIKHDELMKKGLYNMIVYRHPETFSVQYIQMGVFDKLCIDFMQSDKLPLAKAIELVFQRLHLEQVQFALIRERTLQVFNQFQQDGFILGAIANL